jgi:acyl dehydratase
MSEYQYRCEHATFERDENMEKIVLESPSAFKDYEGQEIAVSDWMDVTQDQINLFAQATGDFQWIHVDVERAKAESPYGGTIAHGYFSLSVIPALLWQVIDVQGVKLMVNYGLNKVRFPAPVPVGSRIRARSSVTAVKELDGGNMEVEFSVTIEVEGAEKPACVAATIARYYV